MIELVFTDTGGGIPGEKTDIPWDSSAISTTCWFERLPVRHLFSLAGPAEDSAHDMPGHAFPFMRHKGCSPVGVIPGNTLVVRSSACRISLVAMPRQATITLMMEMKKKATARPTVTLKRVFSTPLRVRYTLESPPKMPPRPPCPTSIRPRGPSSRGWLPADYLAMGRG